MKTAAVLTYGCAHNQKDSQLIEGQLLKHGYRLVDEDEAELVVVNTCTVKEPTESKIISKLDRLQGSKQVVVAGCLSQASPEKIRKRYPDFVVMGINAAPYIVDALDSHERMQVARSRQVLELPITGNAPALKSMEHTLVDKPLLEGNLWNPNLNIIQINEGCLNSCTFCATKLARGRLMSYTSSSIIRSIRRHPTPEVWLTSQDTGCWGFDIGDNIANLIGEIDRIERKFWVRVGMGNPNNFIKVLDEVVEAYHSEKLYKFLHLPVQAGSNRVLKHMRRGYTVEEYELIVERFREEFPDLMLSTDIIVGYPTETEEEFEMTLETLRNTRPNITNISKYWKRSGTPAAKLEQLPDSVKKGRSRRVRELVVSMQEQDNRRWVGWEGEALVVAEGEKGGMECRNQFYRPIIIQEGELGAWVNVRITESHSTYFMGELI